MFSFDIFPDFSPPDDVLSWVRLLLTGKMSGTDPEDATISALATSAIGQVNLRYPSCLTGAPSTLTEDDLAAYNEAIACFVAARFVGMPGGAKFAQYVVESKQGTVTRKLSSPEQTKAEASKLLMADGNAALNRIACVRERVVVANTNASKLFGLAGVSRSKKCGC